VRGYHATESYKRAMRKRAVWVEPRFGEATPWHGLRRFRVRGLPKVTTEALVCAAGQNLKRWLVATGWGRRYAPCGALGAAHGPPAPPRRQATYGPPPWPRLVPQARRPLALATHRGLRQRAGQTCCIHHQGCLFSPVGGDGAGACSLWERLRRCHVVRGTSATGRSGTPPAPAWLAAPTLPPVARPRA